MSSSLSGITAARVVVTQRGAFGSRGGQPVQIVMGGPSYEELAGWRDKVMKRLDDEVPGLTRVDSDYKETKPQFELEVDVGRAGDLGVRIGDIAQAIESMFGERRVTRFQDRGEEYEVMLQAPIQDRADPSALGKVYRKRSLAYLGNFFANFLHLALWVAVLWPVMRFTLGHAVGIGLALWGVTMLVVQPTLFGLVTR